MTMNREPTQDECERWEFWQTMQKALCRQRQAEPKVEMRCMMCGETFTMYESELADAEGFVADCDCCGGIAIRAERFAVLDYHTLRICRTVCVQAAGYQPFTYRLGYCR